MNATNITRRAALGAIASIPAIGGAVASEAAAPEPAPPVEREYAVQCVNRLANELAHAMDDWMAEGRFETVWEAQIWPASTGRGIYFKNRCI